jgi:hypothetical protein
VSYAGMQYGANQFYGGPQYTYGSAQAEADRQAQLRAYGQSVEGQREAYERSLQQGEQQRRMYDSETARQSQERKYGVLDGLVKQWGGGDMTGGMYDGLPSLRRIPMGSTQKKQGFGGKPSGMGGSR